jgi:hypothetical protein
VTLPKPDGGERELSVPTVVDRLIQQARLQVSGRIEDAGVARLIRASLNSGIMSDGVAQVRDRGAPQGGPMSRLLANVLLHEVDKELERRGQRFVRYADDANVYVRSRRTRERVMALLRSLYEKLKLTIHESKSAIASVFGRKFLGYSLWVARGRVVKRKVADKPLATFKQRVRQLTRRSDVTQHGTSGGWPAAVPAGMERLLRIGANAERLALTGRMVASPDACDPTQAVEARDDHLPRTAGAGRQTRGCNTYGGQ